MTVSAELTAQVGVAVDELKQAKERFEDIRQDTDEKVASSQSSLEAWKTTAFQSEEAAVNVAMGSQTEIDLKHLSQDMMYPVVLKGSSNKINHYEITRSYSGDRVFGASLAGLFFKCSWVGDSWGGNPLSLIIERSEQTYILSMGLAGFVSYYQAAVFLRGGYKYHLRSSNADQKYVVYETETLFYQDPSEPDHDSVVGPITPEAALLIGGALTTTNLYNVAHNHNLTGVGETNAS